LPIAKFSKTLRTWALPVFSTFDNRKTVIFSLRCGSPGAEALRQSLTD
jgi:hypothetical protein